MKSYIRAIMEFFGIGLIQACALLSVEECEALEAELGLTHGP